MSKGFIKFVNYCLRVLFILIVIGSIAMLYFYPKVQFIGVKHIFLKGGIVTLLNIVLIILIYKYCEENQWNKKAVITIIIVGFMLRVLWVLFVQSQPTSDFKLIYDSGKDFAEGNYSIFKGTKYLGRFPHLTIFTIYIGGLRKIFGNTLVPIKIINVILSTLNIYLVYLISCQVYKEKKQQVLSLMAMSFLPTMIVYTSVVCSENIAMSFFLLSIYLFLMIVNKTVSISYSLLCGFILSIGNLFRMVGYVFLVAFILYLIIYKERKDALKNSTYIFLAFLITLCISSNILIKYGITNHKLWKGSEPAITSVLRGTNIKSLGMWNEEDGKICTSNNYDYKKVEKASKDIIKQRLTNTPAYKLTLFYISKFAGQWSIGDFYGVGWATENINGNRIVVDFIKAFSVYAQLFHIVVILLVFLGLYNSKQYLENNNINLFYIFFCGFALLYLITEMQPRYAFIVCWIFVILAPTYEKGIFRKYRKPISRELGV